MKPWSSSTTRAALLIALASSLGACKKQEKPKVRTEPWPAPAVSVSSSVPAGATVPYTLSRGSVQIELRARKRRTTARLDRIEGTLAFDPVHLDRTRGSVRADLLDLKLFGAGEAEEDPSLTLAALRALELTPERSAEGRDLDRHAELAVTGFELPRPTATDRRPSKAVVKTFVELTLHRFRVPYTVDLEIELSKEPAGAPPELRVRTHRPLVVPLVGHDILPRDGSGTLARSPTVALDQEIAREARVSAELFFRPALPSASPSANP